MELNQRHVGNVPPFAFAWPGLVAGDRQSLIKLFPFFVFIFAHSSQSGEFQLVPLFCCLQLMRDSNDPDQ
jgi:hypothetical protein